MPADRTGIRPFSLNHIKMDQGVLFFLFLVAEEQEGATHYNQGNEECDETIREGLSEFDSVCSEYRNSPERLDQVRQQVAAGKCIDNPCWIYAKLNCCRHDIRRFDDELRTARRNEHIQQAAEPQDDRA